MSTFKASPLPRVAEFRATILCHDILATIFDYLAPGRRELDDAKATTNLRQSCRQDLASCAITCHTLSHHALDVLWRELDDVYPLLKVLPNYRLIDLQVTFSGAVLPEHWARFELYADRVRGIGHPPREGIIHPSVWMLLAMSCRNSPLLPRLRILVAPELCVSEISTLFLLVSSTLRAIRISLECEDHWHEEDMNITPHVANSLLQSLSLMAPDLEDIKLHSSFDLGQGYFQSFKDFRRLRNLCLPSYTLLDEPMFQTLSTLTSLEDLSCHVRLSGTPTLSLPPNAFQRLTGLDIVGHLDHLVTFIVCCQFSLARLNLQITIPASSHPQPAASFAAISQHCNPSSLTDFSAFFLDKLTASSRDHLVEYFEPFLAFPNVTTFRFSSFFTEPSISDDGLARFGAAWPRLATFRIEHRWLFSSSDAAVFPTLSGVIDLARRCPSLEELHLPKVDVGTFPDRGSLPRHGLRSLTIQNVVVPSSPEEYSDVASVLDSVFPTISFGRATTTASRVRNEWNKILRRVQAMRRERKH